MSQEIIFIMSSASSAALGVGVVWAIEELVDRLMAGRKKHPFFDHQWEREAMLEARSSRIRAFG